MTSFQLSSKGKKRLEFTAEPMGSPPPKKVVTGGSTMATWDDGTTKIWKGIL